MVLQLHVWGPAFGLPSIDAECLAAIAFLAQTLGPADYQLVQSSPSAVPTPADTTAYTAFLTSDAAPLLALSLYVSSANYAAATRPAYSAILPLPLPWTEPPAVRAAMARRAAHLGMSSLDTDALAEREREQVEREGKEGWVTVPSVYSSLRKDRGKGVGGMLTPEQRARIRLEGLAAEVLDVLAGVDWMAQSVEARCLAFGYLALMLVPEVPRPWLREVLEGRYGGLCEFVRGFTGEVFPEGGRGLPWVSGGDGVVAVGMRFVRGVVAEVPVVGEQWGRWWTARKKREVLGSSGVKTASGGDLLLLLGAGLGLTAVGAGVFLYRGLPPFGEAVQVWRKPLVTLGSFGAAGAMFSGALYGID